MKIKSILITSVLAASLSASALVMADNDKREYGVNARAQSADHKYHSAKHRKGKGRLAAMDHNKDGNVSRSEFMQGANKRFKKMDRNNDGAIDKNDKLAKYIKK